MRTFVQKPNHSKITSASHTPKSTVDPRIETTVRSSRGHGQPLATADREFFESQFGHDFAKVRIYSNPAAEESARSLRAKAFTTGWNIFFGSGRFAPRTAAGRALLAHELTHVIEQESLNLTTVDNEYSVRGESPVSTLQLAPEDSATEPAPALDGVDERDPLLDEEAMMAVAREGARQLDAYLTTYTLGCNATRREMTLSEAFVSGKIPVFSNEYEATIATIRRQALVALRQAKGFFDNLEANSMSRWGAAALESTNVAITAIEDGHDIVFVVDSRTEDGRSVLSRIDHFQEQLAIRDRGFQDEEGQEKRVSAGLSVHKGQMELGQAVTAPRPQHRSVTILDIGALYDNRVLNDVVGPIQNPPGSLHIQVDTAAAVDIRALFIHEVGGHASSFETPAARERRLHGDPITEKQKKASFDLEEALVDNMVNKVAFFSLIRDDLPRPLIQRLGAE